MKYTYEVIENAEMKFKIIKRTDESGVIAWIPLDPANSDYQAYLEHEAATI
jgi:hypothetical protein